MFKNNLLKNPVGWSKVIAGTNAKFCLMVSLNIILWIASSLVVDDSFAILLLIPIVIFPSYYLYALKRVLQELMKLQKEETLK